MKAAVWSVRIAGILRRILRCLDHYHSGRAAAAAAAFGGNSGKELTK
ncbi:MAG: hypothetical protein VB086_09940 [Clostridiaceae bacterium]|nr:hypothetical protein [Clostridiaceae bacterium]